jgi:hypothetical protein
MHRPAYRFPEDGFEQAQFIRAAEGKVNEATVDAADVNKDRPAFPALTGTAKSGHAVAVALYRIPVFAMARAALAEIPVLALARAARDRLPIHALTRSTVQSMALFMTPVLRG